MQRLLFGDLPVCGAAGLEKCRGCFWGSSRCAGLLDYRHEEAAFGGAFAARGCSLGVRKRLLLRDLPLRGAARLGKCRGCFLGSSRCAGLLAWSKEEAALGGAPAARGCWIQTGGGCFRGSSRCAGLLDWRNAAAAFGGAPAARGCSLGVRKRLLLGELPLRGAAGLQTGGGCFWVELSLRGAARLE